MDVDAVVAEIISVAMEVATVVNTSPTEDVAVIAMLLTLLYVRKLKSSQQMKPTGSLTGSDNYNLSRPKKELLRWHCHLSHLGMKQVQWLFHGGTLSTSEVSHRQQEAATTLTCAPLCTACQCAKQLQHSDPGTKKTTVAHEKDALKREQLYPGQYMSIDHFHLSL